MAEKVFIPPVVGQTIAQPGANYVIGRHLGQGYFGAVFECTDDWGNELVAKVFLPRDQPYEAVRANWMRELECLVHLRHPHVTYVYDAFEHDDTFYLIIERCSGSLDKLITWQGLEGALWLLPIARCVLQALRFIHGAGYVHKDLHPGNVFTSEIRDEMVPQKPRAMQFKVGDLGITRLVSDMDVFNTMLAQWMLPPEFLRPEEFGLIDHRVDIYHAALVFLSLLLGEELNFTREEIVGGAPRSVAAQLDSPFGAPLARALRRHVSSRTPDALAFWPDLSQAGAG